MIRLQRREFITLLSGAAAAWPCNGLAQSLPKRPLIGFLGASSKSAGARYYGGFPLGMRELGYLEGRDYGFEDRYGDGDASRLPLLAEELVRLKPDVIVTATTPGTLAAKQASASIPIIGVNLTDPVNFGLVTSEARPGTNVTGVLYRLEGMTEKQVEIALDLQQTRCSAELAPELRRSRHCRVILQNVPAPIIETMTDTARERALDDEKVAAPPVTFGTAPVSLRATARALLPLDLDLLLSPADAQPQRLAREAPEGRAGKANRFSPHRFTSARRDFLDTDKI